MEPTTPFERDSGPAVLPAAPQPDADNHDSSEAPGPRPRFTLHRSRTDRMIGGVCGGLAESLGVDAALLRIGLVALTVLGAGSGVVLYVAAWIVTPEADTGT